MKIVCNTYDILEPAIRRFELETVKNIDPKHLRISAGGKAATCPADGIHDLVDPPSLSVQGLGSA